MYRRIDKSIHSIYIYMLVEIVKVGNLHVKLRCGTKESFQSWRQTKTTSEALQREQCHRGAHGLGRWRVLQDWTTIWFNLIQLYWSITWDTWWLVVEWVLNKPTSKGSAMKCRFHHCVTRLQETEQEGSDEEYDGGMHVSLGTIGSRKRTGSEIWKYVESDWSWSILKNL